MGTSQELTFVSTKDLMEELARRHDAVVILGMRFTSKDGYNIARFHRGHRYVCLGMLSNAATLINDMENGSLKYCKEDNV